MNLAPVIGAHGVLAIHDGRLISFNTSAGTIGWQLQEDFTGQPSVAGGRIYAVNYGGLSVYEKTPHPPPLWPPGRAPPAPPPASAAPPAAPPPGSAVASAPVPATVASAVATSVMAAAAKPLPAASVASKDVVDKPYFINVGLFAVPSNAAKAHARLLDAHLPSVTRELKSSKGLLTRVRAGPFPSLSLIHISDPPTPY